MIPYRQRWPQLTGGTDQHPNARLMGEIPECNSETRNSGLGPSHHEPILDRQSVIEDPLQSRQSPSDAGHLPSLEIVYQSRRP